MINLPDIFHLLSSVVATHLRHSERTIHRPGTPFPEPMHPTHESCAARLLSVQQLLSELWISVWRGIRGAEVGTKFRTCSLVEQLQIGHTVLERQKTNTPPLCNERGVFAVPC
jgi:hypothetical protein